MYAYCGNNPVNRVDCDGKSWLGILLLTIVTVSIYEFVVSCLISDVSEEDEVEGAAIPPTTNDSNYSILHYETDTDTVSKTTYNVSGKISAYNQSYETEGNISSDFDLLKVEGSIGYGGASAGMYLGEITASQKYNIFGKEITLSLGVNYGFGASLSFGKKSVFGFSAGWGWIISLEVE